MNKKKARERFNHWRKNKEGREYLAVLFVEADGKCPKCLQYMVLSYEDKAYENRATFNHKVPLADISKITTTVDTENLEILCWTCNHQDGVRFNHEKQMENQAEL